MGNKVAQSSNVTAVDDYYITNTYPTGHEISRIKGRHSVWTAVDDIGVPTKCIRSLTP